MSLLEVLRKQSKTQKQKILEELHQKQAKATNSNQGDDVAGKTHKKRPRLERSDQSKGTPTHKSPRGLPPSKSPSSPSQVADAAPGEATSTLDAGALVSTAVTSDRQELSEQVPCADQPLALRPFQITPGGTLVLTSSNGEGTEGGAHSKAAENAGMLWFESPLMKPAFENIDQQPEALQKHLKVFSVERENGKGRTFICTTSSRFWSHYRDLRSDQRHHYEIIRQGMPCHLYFDLEFDPRVNPDVDGDGLVDLLVLECVALMKELFNITLKPEQKVLELDSSAPTKWSRHVVVHQRRAFAHNGHVNAFVRVLIERLRRRAELEQQQQQQQQQQRDKLHPDTCQMQPDMHPSEQLQHQQQHSQRQQEQQQQQCQCLCQQQPHMHRHQHQEHQHEFQSDLCQQQPHAHHSGQQLQCQGLCQQQPYTHQQQQQQHEHEFQPDLCQRQPQAHHSGQLQRCQDLCQQLLHTHCRGQHQHQYELQTDFSSQMQTHLHHSEQQHQHQHQQLQQQQQQQQQAEHAHAAPETPSISPTQVALPNTSTHTCRSTQPHSPNALPHSQLTPSSQVPLPNTSTHTSRSTHRCRARYSDMWVVKEAGGSRSKPQQPSPDVSPCLDGPDQPHAGCWSGDAPAVQCDGSMRESGPDGGLENASGAAEPQRTLFIDTGVYTRNRAFRLCWSSKAGKEHKLRPTHRYAMATLLSRNGKSSSSNRCISNGDGVDSSKALSLPKAGGEPEGQQHCNQQGQKPQVQQQHNLGQQHHDQHHPHDPQQEQQQRQQQRRPQDLAEPQGFKMPQDVAEPQGCAGLPALKQQQQHNGQPQELAEPQEVAKLEDVAEPRGLHALMHKPHKRGRMASQHHSPSACLEHPDFAMAIKQAEAVFLQSLVTDTHGCDGTPQLCMFDEAEAAQHTGFILWDGSGTKSGRRTSSTHAAQQAALTSKPTQIRPGSSLFGYGCSPLGAELDGFVRDVCGSQGGLGSSEYRTWLLALESQTITYTSKNTRWCAKIGRQHKSNGVYWVIDLRNGTWVQRCHDPDCAGFSSHALPLPVPLWQAVANKLMGLRASLVPQQRTQQQNQQEALEEQQCQDHLDPAQQQTSHQRQHQHQQQTLQEQQQHHYSGLEQQQQQQQWHLSLSGQAGDASEAEYDELCCRALELYEASMKGASGNS